MTRDTLYLLPPGFEDRGARQYCPECAEIWGVLAYYPALRETLEIAYVGLAHPRTALVERLGEGDWNAPTMVLAEGSPDGPGVKTASGGRYLDAARDIGRYWASLHGTAAPR
ncbi:MAG: DUF3088 family protein [Pseudomonadota bacterium]